MRKPTGLVPKIFLKSSSQTLMIVLSKFSYPKRSRSVDGKFSTISSSGKPLTSPWTEAGTTGRLAASSYKPALKSTIFRIETSATLSIT